MSEDIVTRLRGAAIDSRDENYLIEYQLVFDAADEIERLRQELQQTRELLDVIAKASSTEHVKFGVGVIPAAEP